MFSQRQTGITMVELILTIVIISVALVGISAAMTAGSSRSSDITLQLRTVALAQAYLDEILGKRFDENTRNRGIPPCRPLSSRLCTAEGSFGSDGGETRATFDDVDDYHGLDEGDGQVNPLQDADGNTRTGYDNFRVQVSVRYINIAGGEEEETLGIGPELDGETDAKVVTVTVSSRSQPDGFKFSAYKSNF